MGGAFAPDTESVHSVPMANDVRHVFVSDTLSLNIHSLVCADGRPAVWRNRIAFDEPVQPTENAVLSAEQRGLIISSPVIVGEDVLQLDDSGLDPQEIRLSLLFWDKFDFPLCRAFQIGNCEIADFLSDCGVLTRSMPGPDAGSLTILRETYLNAFFANNAREPGRWSIATGKRSIDFCDEDIAVGRGVLVILHRALPVPNKDVPLADILEFKEKRRPELLALRHYLENVYQRVFEAGDGALALNTAIEQLKIGVTDYMAAARGMAWAWRLVDLEASLTLRDVCAIGALSYAVGTPLLEAIGHGLSGSATLSLARGAGLCRLEPTSTPFKYVSRYHNELFPII